MRLIDSSWRKEKQNISARMSEEEIRRRMRGMQARDSP